MLMVKDAEKQYPPNNGTLKELIHTFTFFLNLPFDMFDFPELWIIKSMISVLFLFVTTKIRVLTACILQWYTHTHTVLKHSTVKRVSRADFKFEHTCRKLLPSLNENLTDSRQLQTTQHWSQSGQCSCALYHFHWTISTAGWQNSRWMRWWERPPRIGGRSNGETCCWVTLDECVWMMMDGCMVGWVRGGGGGGGRGNGGTKSLEDKTDDVHVAGWVNG